MQKSVFYAIVGISIAVTAASFGFSASRILSVRYFTPPVAAAGRSSATDAARTAALTPEQWTNVFAPDQKMELPSKIAGSARQAEAASKTKFVLLGTIASDSPAARRAILWAEGMKDPRLEREGSELEPGVRLAQIERDFVFLSRGKEREKLEILPVGSRTRSIAPPAPPVAASSPSAPAAVGEIRVTKLGENLFALDEATVSQLTGNINQYMTNVRLIPYFEGNHSAGFRVASIRPGSAFEQLGFRGGDVIQQVNSVDLSTPDKVYTIFQNLKDEKRVTVNILRQGQKSSIMYEIR